jgi:hypothetical protein
VQGDARAVARKEKRRCDPQRRFIERFFQLPVTSHQPPATVYCLGIPTD